MNDRFEIKPYETLPEACKTKVGPWILLGVICITILLLYIGGQLS